MSIAFVLVLIFAVVACSREGNMHFLEDELEAALKACAINESIQFSVSRVRRSNRNATHWQSVNNNEQYPLSFNLENTANKRDPNLYHHQRRNASDLSRQNATGIVNDHSFEYENQFSDESTVKTRNPFLKNITRYNSTFPNRNKRSERLKKYVTDQCLGQCVFANLHVVDSRGIPRENDLWNKVESTVTSQRSRIALQDEIRACFQELQDEAEEEDGCAYSNKLERCLMLGFSDRMKLIKNHKS